MTATTADLVEIFPSIQGEGLLVGTPQVFVRLAGCDQHCSYCDTPAARGAAPRQLRHTVGGVTTEVSNPLDAARVVTLVGQTVSTWPALTMAAITGGEPLLAVDFLEELLPGLRHVGLGIQLETNGLLPEAFGRVVSLLDVASVDIKLPRTTALPSAEITRRTRELLSVAMQVKGLHCKVVLTEEDTDEELRQARDLVAEVWPRIPMYLTPVTEIPGGPRPPDLARLMQMAALFRERLESLRILPQVHRLAHWR